MAHELDIGRVLSSADVPVQNRVAFPAHRRTDLPGAFTRGVSGDVG